VDGVVDVSTYPASAANALLVIKQATKTKRLIARGLFADFIQAVLHKNYRKIDAADFTPVDWRLIWYANSLSMETSAKFPSSATDPEKYCSTSPSG
jgi:hypothetical protein